MKVVAGDSYLCADTVCIYFIIIEDICLTWLIKIWVLKCENSFVYSASDKPGEI